VRLIKYKTWPFTQLRKLLLFYRHIWLNDRYNVIASYPKSGNTWIRFILASLITGEEATFDNVCQIVPEIERFRSAEFSLPDGKKFIKTHEMWRPAYKKSLYIIRDGRDVSISYYYFQKSLGRFEGTFSEFLKLFIEGRVDGYGGWSGNVRSWVRQCERDPESVCVIKYEDMLSKPIETVRGVVDFFSINASESEIEWAIEGNKASKMKNKEGSSENLANKLGERQLSFVRKAVTNQWKDVFSTEDIELFNQELGELNRQLGYK
jgi:hypothetical protein